MPSDADNGVRKTREREYFDEAYAANLRAPLDKYYCVTRPAVDRYESLLKSIGSGASVLEYGCGTGSYAFSLAQRGSSVVGIDISPVGIERASEAARSFTGSGDLTFRVMDAEALDFSSGSFDVVCGVSILHHLDLRRALPEVARVLRPGGYAVFKEPLGHNPLINRFRGRTPHYRSADEHPLRRDDFVMMGRHFRCVDVEAFNLLSLAAYPLHASSSFPRVLDVLDGLDQKLFRLAPPLRYLAWTSVIRLAARGRTAG